MEVRYPPPPQKGYLSDTCAMPYETRQNACDTPSAILSRNRIARYGGVSRTGPLRSAHAKSVYNVQMDAAVLGDRLLEGTRKPLLGPGSPSLQVQHLESSKVLAGLAFCEMP